MWEEDVLPANASDKDVFRLDQLGVHMIEMASI